MKYRELLFITFLANYFVNLFTPILPAIILGTAASFLQGKWRVWYTGILVFVVLLIYGLYVTGLPSCPTDIETLYVETCKPDYSPLWAVFYTALFYGALALVLHGVGVGLDRYLRHYIETPWFRYIVVSYITLLLLQLWVEVFPWTLSIPYRYS